MMIRFSGKSLRMRAVCAVCLVGVLGGFASAADYPTILASNLTNGEHTLELVATDGEMPAIGAIRIHKPPVK